MNGVLIIGVAAMTGLASTIIVSRIKFVSNLYPIIQVILEVAVNIAVVIATIELLKLVEACING